MKDQNKTKSQLIAELKKMRQRVSKLEQTETEQVKAKTGLHAEKEFADTALDAQLDTFFLFDPATNKALRWNHAFREISGYTDEEITKLPAPASYYSSDDIKKAETFIQEVLKEGSGTIELEFICKDGRKVPTEYRVSVINDDQGGSKYIISIGRDITKRRQAEEALRESGERGRWQRNAIVELTLGEDSIGIDLQRAFEKVCEILSVTIDVARTSVWELSEDGSELRCLNLYEADKNAHSHGLVLNAQDIPKYFNAIKTESRIYAENVQNDPRADELTESYLKPLGITSMLDAGVVIDGKLVGVVCCEHIGKMREWHSDEEAFVSTVAAFVAQLIVESERKQTEVERENLISELEAKNAELERFTYTISHDLKSPLITINGFLGHLQDDIASGNTDRAERDSQRIHQAVEKMHQLLKELLELSRIGRLMNPPEPVPFEGLAREALVLVHGQLELRGVTFSLGPDLPVVYGDRQRLIEVLQNLIDNAVKFMGDQPDPHIEIGQRGEEDGKPVLYVKDNGIGISPEYHDRIFGLFDKLDAHDEGTGIGLALVKRIVEFHGGRIWVESEAGQGATFYFTLPRNAEQLNNS